MADPRTVWSAMLAKMVAPIETRAPKAINDLVAFLKLPDETFTLQSAEYVATEGYQSHDGKTGPLTRLPTFGELQRALNRWSWKRTELERLEGVPQACERLSATDVPVRDETAQEHVQALVRAFVAERSFNHSNTPDDRKVKPRHLTENQLTAIYKQLGIRGPRPEPMSGQRQ